MTLQPIKQPPCFGGRKAVYKEAGGVGVQLVPNQHRLIGIGVIYIEQHLALLGQIGRRFSGAHTDLAMTHPRVQQVDRRCRPLVPVVIATRLAWLGGVNMTVGAERDSTTSKVTNLAATFLFCGSVTLRDSLKKAVGVG